MYILQKATFILLKKDWILLNSLESNLFQFNSISWNKKHYY